MTKTDFRKALDEWQAERDVAAAAEAAKTAPAPKPKPTEPTTAPTDPPATTPPAERQYGNPRWFKRATKTPNP
jgi:hypothetical protein